MEKTDECRLRWNTYENNDWGNARNDVCMREHLSERFKSKGNSDLLGNVSITLIDKADDKDLKRRKKCWMWTFKTYAPFGLNIANSV